MLARRGPTSNFPKGRRPVDPDRQRQDASCTKSSPGRNGNFTAACSGSRGDGPAGTSAAGDLGRVDREFRLGYHPNPGNGCWAAPATSTSPRNCDAARLVRKRDDGEYTTISSTG